MDKYIFLDFDGVITNEESHYKLNRVSCDLLGRILKDTDAKIVITSSWRKSTLEDTIKYLNTISHFVPFEFPYSDNIIGQTIRAYHYIHEIHLGVPRGVEIKQWIDTHIHSNNGRNYILKKLGKDYQYVILDDDNDMLLEQKDNFIKTDSHKGLNVRNVFDAIQVLNTTNHFDM